MRPVNAASKSISALIDSAWKASQSKTSDRATTASATKTAASARKDLTTLRQLTSREVDIERAASSIVGKLISLEMVRPLRFSPLPRLSSTVKYNATLGLLQDM